MIAISTNIHQVTSVQGERHQSSGTRWFNLWITTEWGQKIEITLFHDEAHAELFEQLEGALKFLEPRTETSKLLLQFNKAIQEDIKAGISARGPRLATIRQEPGPCSE